MAKPNKSAKRNARSAKQVHRPLLDVERGTFHKKSRSIWPRKNSRAVAQSNSVVQKQSESVSESTKLSTTGDSGLLDQPKDILKVPKGSPTHRDLSVLVQRAEEQDSGGTIQRVKLVHFIKPNKLKVLKNLLRHRF